MKIRVAAFFLLCVVLAGCEWMQWKVIKPAGQVQTEAREVSSAARIKLAGNYQVQLTPGDKTTLRIEADTRFLSYILTRMEDGELVIRNRDNVRFSGDDPVKIYITTPLLEKISLAGSGNITGMGKFTGADMLELKIAGSGDIQLATNTPRIHVEIAGTGSIKLAGETQDADIHIAGSGDYLAEELKAENARVEVAGSGNVRLFAASKLDVQIAGVGSVFYKGNPAITQSITGSGEIKKLDQ
ncbi:MAG TPA: head GIN domain-containing protein [Sediminibacterium sp.]|nr:head GIN domain-containing protein [Sediminibacterium sp.]